MKVEQFKPIQTYGDAFVELVKNRDGDKTGPFIDEIYEGMVESETLANSRLKPSKISSEKIFGLQSDSPLLGRLISREIGKAYRLLNRPHPIVSDDEALTQKSGERIIRQLVARCFKDEPLVPLNPEIRGLYKGILRAAFRDRISRQVDKLSAWFSEDAFRFVGSEINSLNDVGKSANLYLTAGFIDSDDRDKFKDLSNDCHARAKHYADQDIHLESTIDEIRQRKGKDKVYVLDLGCSGARALYDLKCKYGDKIVTVGISLYEEPHLHADLFLNRPFEVLPTSFESRFDLVLSRYGYDYSLLPHVAMEGAFRCLAPSGVFHMYRGSVCPLGRFESEHTVALLTEIYFKEMKRLGSEVPEDDWKKYFQRASTYLGQALHNPVTLSSTKHSEELNYCANALMNYVRHSWDNKITTDIGDGPSVFLGRPTTTEIYHWVTFTRQ